jgi:hypothetical protein
MKLWFGLIKNLHDYLERGVSIENIRQQAANKTGQDNRKRRVTRRAGDPHQLKIPWSMTIIDVAHICHDSASYRDLIKLWARTVLKEMQP